MNKQDQPSSPAPVHRLDGRIGEMCQAYEYYYDAYFAPDAPFSEERPKAAEIAEVLQEMCRLVPKLLPIINAARKLYSIEQDMTVPDYELSRAVFDLGDLLARLDPPIVRDHQAGPDDPSKAGPTIVAGSGASTCWADAQSAKDAK